MNIDPSALMRRNTTDNIANALRNGTPGLIGPPQRQPFSYSALMRSATPYALPLPSQGGWTPQAISSGADSTPAPMAAQGSGGWVPGQDIPPESGAGRAFRLIAPGVVPYGAGVIPGIIHNINTQRMTSGNRDWNEAAQNAPVDSGAQLPSNSSSADPLPQGGPPNPMGDHFRSDVGLRPEDPSDPLNTDPEGNPVPDPNVVSDPTDPNSGARGYIGDPTGRGGPPAPMPTPGGYPNFAGTHFDYSTGTYVANNPTGSGSMVFDPQAQNLGLMDAQMYGGRPNQTLVNDESRVMQSSQGFNPRIGYQPRSGGQLPNASISPQFVQAMAAYNARTRGG